jgi:hypothetical protein
MEEREMSIKSYVFYIIYLQFTNKVAANNFCLVKQLVTR